MRTENKWKKKLQRRQRAFGQSVISLVRRVRISKRLTGLFLLASLLPLLMVGTLIYNETSETLYNNMNKAIVSMSRQTASYISEKVRKVISDSVEISNSEIVQNILRSYEEYDSVRLYQTTKEVIREMSKKYVFNDIVTEITVYTTAGQRVNLYGPYAYRFKPTLAELEEMKRKNDESPQNRLFSFNSNNSVIVFRQVRDKATRETIGYLVMRIDENCISNIYPDALTDVDIDSFVVNSDGVIVSSKDEDMLAKSYPDEALTRRIKEEDLDELNEFLISLPDGKKVVNHSKIVGTNWQFISLVSDSFFRVDMRQFLKKLIVRVIVFLLLAMMISLVVAFSILLPTRAIIEAMKSYEEGREGCIVDTGHDELTFMADTFNQMSERIGRQMQDIRDAENQKRRLEIQALQAQINPHFIANTLNLISDIASVNNETGIEELSNSLVDLMRDCIQGDERFVRVEEELSMLQSYINIQDYRMLGKFSVRMEIEPDILEYRMPHLILQPIVENAVLHGVLPDRKKRGQISIGGRQECGMLVFSVRDNGKGMSQEQIARIFSEEDRNREKGRFNSIGLYNVHQRIQLLFGPEYGLSIGSEPEEYTLVTVRLPVITEEVENVPGSIGG